MKKLVLIILILCIYHVMLFAQIPVFSYSKDGNVNVNSTFIEKLYHGTYDNITPYKVKSSMIVNDNYQVKCQRFRGWDDDTGDFNNVEVSYRGKQVLSLDYDDGWDYFHKGKALKGDKAKPFHQVKLSNDTYAICFTGLTIMSQTPFMTIIVLKDGKATLVYNKETDLHAVVQLSDGSTRFDIQDDVDRVDFVNGKETVIKGVEHTLTFKDGMVYFQ